MYITIQSYPDSSPALPEMSVGSGAVDLEKIFAFAKRTVAGNMLLRGYKGSVIKFEGKWSVLTRKQFNGLCNFLTNNASFNISVYDPRILESTTPAKRTIEVYPGNIHAEPLFVDKATGVPHYYQNVTVNFISVGVA